jgi:hypothetical protein
VPSPELQQLMGATRKAAQSLPEVRALWRAETFADVPSPRPVLDLHVDLDDTSVQRRQDVLQALAMVAADVEPRPLRLTASVLGSPCSDAELASAIMALDEPFYRRT